MSFSLFLQTSLSASSFLLLKMEKGLLSEEGNPIIEEHHVYECSKK
jgi:hypothetical protein